MIKSANLAKEIIISTGNKVGILASIAKMTAEHGINIEAVAGYVEPDNTARLMMITDDHQRTMDALKKMGFSNPEEHEIVMVELENKAGALKILAEKLAVGKIDIRYAYGTASGSTGTSRLVLGTSDNEKTVVALQK